MPESTGTSTLSQTALQTRIVEFANIIDGEVIPVAKKLLPLGINAGSEESSAKSLNLFEERCITFDDLRAIFPEVPVGFFRKGFYVLTGQSAAPETKPVVDAPSVSSDNAVSDLAKAVQQMATDARPINKMSDEELLRKYNDRDSEIASVLSKRSGQKPFIVFDSNGDVDVALSLRCLKIVKSQGVTKDYIMIEGVPVQTYRPGTYLEKPKEESPFFPGEALIDGVCQETGFSWSGIPHKLRVLARLQVTQVEKVRLGTDGLRAVHVYAQTGEDPFIKAYPMAALRYKQLEEKDELPKLKLFATSAGKKDSPFA